MESEVTTNPEGRPTKYKAAYNKQARKLCLLGATDSELADFFEVAESTINLWKLTYPNFKKAVNAGKIQADATVAESLFKSATGFEYNEVTFEKTGEEDAVRATTEGDLVKGDTYKKKIVTKMIPPNGRDAAFWLKNRRKNDWRDKHEIESTNRNITTIIDWSDDGADDNNGNEGTGNENDSPVRETEGSSENSST